MFSQTIKILENGRCCKIFDIKEFTNTTHFALLIYRFLLDERKWTMSILEIEST